MTSKTKEKDVIPVNTLTHLGLSSIIRREVERKTGIKMDRLAYIYGTIKPDFSTYVFTVPHFMNKASGFVQGQIKELMDKPLSGTVKLDREFSERLGIITHYLSDFFCRPHFHSYEGTLIHHYFYEKRLWRYFKRNSVKSRQVSCSININMHDSPVSVWKAVEDFHRRYALRRTSFATDITFAIKICVCVIISIVAVCTGQTEKKAA